MRPLWIDTDLGVDDLIALLTVRAAGRAVVGCSLVFGNARLERVVANARAFAATFGWAAPLHVGAARALTAAPFIEPVTAANVLGQSGMPTLGRSLDPTRLAPLAADDAIGALAAWLDGVDEPVDVLALGPLTNLATLALAHPERFARIARITWMGGAATRGNHTPNAEFNAFADPEAVATVARTGVALAMLDLDLCRQVSVGPDDLAVLKDVDTPRGRLLHDLLGGYIDIGLSRGRASMALYDPVAACALLEPGCVRFERVGLEVDPSGSATPGRTRIVEVSGRAASGREGGSIEIGRLADATAIRRRVLDALLTAATEDTEETDRGG